MHAVCFYALHVVFQRGVAAHDSMVVLGGKSSTQHTIGQQMLARGPQMEWQRLCSSLT